MNSMQGVSSTGNMKFLNLTILFLLISTPVKASVLIGDWEGFFSGSHTHQGVMRLSITEKICSIYMKQLDSEETLEFSCQSIIEKNGIYTFVATKQFSAGTGAVEWQFILSMGIGANNSKANTKIVGSWIQGLRDNKTSNFIGLNSGLMRLKEKK
jgi:hypothetical protein